MMHPKRIVLGVLAAMALLFGVLVVRALGLSSRQIAAPPAPELVVVPGEAAARLAEALRFRTISHADPAADDASQLKKLAEHIERSFPRVHRELKREVVATYSLLYTWPGKDPAREPILLMAHLDVVPVEPGTEAAWTEPPFDGKVSDGFVWGRGALDDKGSAFAILEAVELSLAAGFQPDRTVLLAFGHDEEVSGPNGARAIAALLESRGTRLDVVLDEGSGVVEGVVPGIVKPVALIGLGEKGYVSVELVVEGIGGHSAMPPEHTAVGLVAAAIKRLEDERMPSHLIGAARLFFDHMAPEMPFFNKLMLGNLWLTDPFVRWQLGKSRETNAMIRTTQAATMFEGSVKDNVLPARARAAVNFRVAPGDSIAGVLAHVTRVVQDPRVQVRQMGELATEPSGESSIASAGYAALQRTIRQIFPAALVAPSLVLGATDSRHYAKVAKDTYRFAPFTLTRDDLARVHGKDERVLVSAYERAVQFYALLLQNLASAAK